MAIVVEVAEADFFNSHKPNYTTSINGGNRIQAETKAGS